jgi:hypothetical protein
MLDEMQNRKLTLGRQIPRRPNPNHLIWMKVALSDLPPRLAPSLTEICQFLMGI